MNIAGEGEDNAILLAISVILQAKRSESELTELLSKISLDIEKDGVLDNQTLQSALIDEATLLDTDIVYNNVKKRYNDLGLNITVGDFKKHIANFITKSSFTFTKKIVYPATGSWGVNVLSDTTTRIVVPKSTGYHWYHNPAHNTTFSLSAIAPVGTTVRVKITTLAVPDSPYASFGCSPNPWQINYKYDAPTELTLIGNGEKSEAQVTVNLRNDAMKRRIEIYENNATKPTWVREVTFIGDNSPLPGEKIEYPLDQATSNGSNLLHAASQNYNSNYLAAQQYSMVALVPLGNKVKFVLRSVQPYQ